MPFIHPFINSRTFISHITLSILDTLEPRIVVNDFNAQKLYRRLGGKPKEYIIIEEDAHKSEEDEQVERDQGISEQVQHTTVEANLTSPRLG
jgi:rRNA pseudouridine-1189 N-methylase Emg1 (Nep1/Mra1 family)